MKISATIITFNEEKNIAQAIDTLSWADEIIVVDSESTDDTVKIAENKGAKVITQSWLGFGKQKQFAVEQCTNKWIFSLDADERVSDELKNKILQLKTVPKENLADGYRIARLSYYMNKPIRHSGWYPDWQLRLFNKNKGHWKDFEVHESIEMDKDAKVEKLKEEILHYSVENASYHHRMIGERYAPLAAREMYKRGKRTSLLKVSTTGLTTFLQTFVLKGGFMDGFPGFCISKFSAYNSYLKHLLLWELQNKNK